MKEMIKAAQKLLLKRIKFKICFFFKLFHRITSHGLYKDEIHRNLLIGERSTEE